ncbi:MAG: hypothetical protein Q7J10_04270 [Methanosarcinaceae archaeon]|nr:hypothetical protein [Methanosarcinaceae archaeon]
MLPAKTKDWMVAPQWDTMDKAIYSVDRLKLLNGAYWFWLMSDYDKENPRMLQVLISRGAIDYTLNSKRFSDEHIDDDTFSCYCGVWQYRDGEVSDLIHELCTCTVKDGDFNCKTDSGYQISIKKSFPYYDMEIRDKNNVVTKFSSTSTEFKDGYVQNPLVKYPSLMAFSENFDAYARNSRGFQYFIASKMSDLFGTCKGMLFDRDFYGSFWLERALGFGSTLPWKIVMLNFNDRSRMWFRYFPSKILNYGTPLEFIFDDMVTKKRYHFQEMTLNYSGNGECTKMKFSSSTDTIHVTGKGKEGEKISITAKILGRHLYQYDVLKMKFNYYQLVLDIENVSAEVNGVDLMQGKEPTLSYGEDAHFSL